MPRISQWQLTSWSPLYVFIPKERTCCFCKDRHINKEVVDFPKPYYWKKKYICITQCHTVETVSLDTIWINKRVRTLLFLSWKNLTCQFTWNIQYIAAIEMIMYIMVEKGKKLLFFGSYSRIIAYCYQLLIEIIPLELI